MPPDWIICLRHGEKPIDKHGKEGDGLSAAGSRRAYLLANAFAVVGSSLLRDVSVLPSRIFVPRYQDDEPDSSSDDTTLTHRTYLTMKPLIDRVPHIPLEIVAAADKNDVGRLAEDVLNVSEGVVIICWEHDALVAWLQRFAGKVVVTNPDPQNPEKTRQLPCEWDSGRFDVLWKLRRITAAGAVDAEYQFSDLDQDLPIEELYDRARRPRGYLECRTTFVEEPDEEVRS